MTDEIDDDAERPGLRERRRRETLREISAAALDLFERNGVVATTVDDIAHASGISPRTFFRYFPSKEESVLADDGGVEETLRDALDAAPADAHPLAVLEAAWTDQIARFESDPDRHRRSLRIRRLISKESTLLVAALRLDAERAERLVARVAEHLGVEPTSLLARATVEQVVVAVRLAFDEWARRAEAGDSGDLAAIYDEARAAVRAVGGATR